MPVYNLRLATHKDIEGVADNCKLAFEESPYQSEVTFDRSRVLDLVTSIVNKSPNDGFILLADDVSTGDTVGIFGAISSFTTMGLEPIGIELLWWVREDYRKTRLSVELIQGFEAWAEKRGIKRLVLGSMANTHTDSIDKFYKRRGYRQTEYTYFKELK